MSTPIARSAGAAAWEAPPTARSSRRRALPTSVAASDSAPKRLRLAAPDNQESQDAVAALVVKLRTKPDTLAGWSVADAVEHLAQAADGCLVPLMLQHGAPQFYFDEAGTGDDEHRAFRALCRTVVGQQLAGAAARKIWARFCEAQSELTPHALLARVGDDASGLEALREAAGLSNAKARALVDLSQHFADGRLSELLLFDASLSDEEITSRVVSVKGIGPWSAQMFLMFTLHRPNLLPLGDLGVRNGMAKHFQLSGSGTKGALHEKKDAAKMLQCFAPFEPFRSVASWYMWRALETKSYDEAME